MDLPEIKTIIIPPSPETTKVIQKKERKRRVVASKPKWTNTTYEQECEFLQQYTDLSLSSSHFTPDLERLFFQQIERKLSGYKTQDVKKNRYSPQNFIPTNNLLQLLKSSHLICSYCQEPVKLLYEHVREPKQWSLDRIDNTIGHNTGNVCVACLSCNLRRKTIHFERYSLAKKQQFLFVKLPEEKNSLE